MLPKTYKVAGRFMPRLIEKFPFLKYVPVFRQYAPGGRFDPEVVAEKEKNNQPV